MRFPLNQSDAERRRMYDEFGLSNKRAIRTVRVFIAILGAVCVLLVIYLRGFVPAELPLLAVIVVAVLAGEAMLLPGLYGRKAYRLAVRHGAIGVCLRADALEVDERGISLYQGESCLARYGWYAINDTISTQSYVFLRVGRALAPGFAAAIPHTAFANGTQRQAFESLVNEGLSAAQVLQAPPLDGLETDCLWRFGYVFDQQLATHIQSAMQPTAVQKLRRGVALVAGLAGVVVLTLGLVMLEFALGFGTTYVALPIGALGGAFFYLRWRRGRGRFLAASIPEYCYGPMTLELTAEGLHLFNTKYEGVYPWQEVTAVQVAQSQGIVLLRRKKRVITALPLGCAPPEVMQQALQYAQQAIGRDGRGKRQ